MAIRRISLALGVVASIAVGCSLLTSIPDVTSGAGQPGAEGGDAPAASDAPKADASASFCAAQTTPAVFCDDFDDRTNLLARWDSIEPGGTARIDDVEYRSAPHALLSGRPAPGTCRYSTVRKEWGPSFRASRLGFSVHTDAPHPSPVPAVALQGVTISNTTCQVLFVPDPSAPQILEQILPPSGQVLNTNHGLPPMTDGVWHDITVDYDPDGKITVTADGTQVMSEPVGQTCPQGQGVQVVELGWHCVDNAPSTLSVHLDNVTFDPR